MALFFLLGGSETSADAWIDVTRHLEAKGHEASALGWVELPWAAGVEGVVAFLERKIAILKGVILVGHSACGLLLPRIKATNVRGEIYVSALVPQPGASFIEQMFNCPIDVFASEWLEKGRRTKEQSPGALEKLYHATFALAEQQERARACIVCDEDQEVRSEWQRWAAGQLLGIKPQILQSDHLAHVTQARKLSEMLLQIASSWQGA